jgi:acetolactate synthase small subunit
MKHTVVALVQDRPGVLNRIASVFRRRELNIEMINVVRTAESGVSRMTLVTEAKNIKSVVAQLEKLIDVFEVSYVETEADPQGAVLPETDSMLSAGLPCSNLPSTSWAQADGVA